MILDICKVLPGLQSRGMNVIVNWHYEKDDVDMLEVGKEISRIVKFPLNILKQRQNKTFSVHFQISLLF